VATLAIAGVLSGHEASAAVRHLGPTVGFLAALLVLAYGCRQAGLFDALGREMATGARGRPRRLLAMVFLAAASTTAVLSLDATVVLLTPIVFATAARLPTSSRPHVFACTHLANSASLVLPISNLTNLLAFQALSISFVRFGGLMAVSWLAALAIEWAVLSRVFGSELAAPAPRAGERDLVAVERCVPLFALGVLGATLVGFGFSSLVGVAPVWFAAAGALVLVARERISLPALVRSAEPTFLVFVLALGMVVRAAGDHGLSSFVDSLVPHGTTLPKLLAIAGIGALCANLLNNLPATLILLPVAAAAAQGACSQC
jgi:arsenical pump membrane protein